MATKSVIRNISENTQHQNIVYVHDRSDFKEASFVARCPMGGLFQNLLLEHMSAHSHDLAVLLCIIKSIAFLGKGSRQMLLVERAAR